MTLRQTPAVTLLTDIAASAVMAFAIAWALNEVFGVAPAIASVAAGVVFIRIFTGLRRSAGSVLLPQFDLRPLEFEPDELLLDDIVTEFGRDSRVVPIFAGANPSELRGRIDRHLGSATSQPEPKTASDELADALDQLWRSLN